MCKSQKEGSITVYLTLILFLVLALITTCVESARVSTAKAYANRVLNTAMRSTLGEYYLPLYERYHLFGLDVGYGDTNKNEEELINRIRQTMEASLKPEINPIFLQWNSNKNFLLCNLSIDSIVINERRTLIDKNGELLKKQAIQYQKYDSAADLLKEFMKKFNLLADTEEANELLEEKLEVETRLYEIDKQMLELVEHVDGFLTDESGIKLNKKGKPSIQNKFVKKLVNFSINQDSVQINNSILYSEIKDQYMNPSDLILAMILKGEEAVCRKEEWEAYEVELNELLEENDYLNPIYIANVIRLKSATSNARNAYDDCISDIRLKQDTIKALVLDMFDATRSALACIGSINKIKRESNTYVDSFIERVKEEKDKLEESFYGELLKSSDDMKAYTDETTTKLSIVYNMTQLKETLEKNEEVLIQLKTLGIPEFHTESINSWKDELTNIKTLFLRYSHDGLIIDYSSFKLEKESNQVLSTFKSLIQSGIAGLVIEDMDGLSKERLPEEDLISRTSNVEKESTSESLDDLLLSVTEEKKDNNTIASLEKVGIDLGGVFADSANVLLENLLYIAYLEGHYSDYIFQEETNEQILNYELEYILFGNTVDKENIEAIATRIILLRLIVNLMHVFTDSQKTNTALTFATTLVGFSGLPFLVSITKYIVLFIWAFEAALIETAAIMMEKEVPILTTRESFTLAFSEILSMNKENIITKAKNYESVKEGFRFGYKEYLRLFLLIQNKSKQNYRTMDLIQENIRYVYDSDFLLSRCYVNYEVSARFEMPQVFLSMPFISSNEMKAVKGYEYKVNAAVSY